MKIIYLLLITVSLSFSQCPEGFYEDSCGNCDGTNTTGCADVEGNEVDCGEQERLV